MHKDLTQADSWAKCIAMAYAAYQGLQPQMYQLFIQIEKKILKGHPYQFMYQAFTS